MTVSDQIEYASLGRLYLDPENPRLGRRNVSASPTQEQVLELMREWNLEELAVSFLENGYWPQEALVAMRRTMDGVPDRLVVVEGNRRLAALKLLKRAIEGNATSRKWESIAESSPAPESLFDRIPYLLVDDPSDLTAFLGFRHVTGIKEWAPAEKAEYITMLIDKEDMSFEQVTRRIGSKLEPVRRNYVAFKILLQLEEWAEEVEPRHVEERFSVFFLALRERAIRDFIRLGLDGLSERVERPVPDEARENLEKLAVWMFGSKKRDPLFTDSREVKRFARALESPEGRAYLENALEPSLEMAARKAGADEDDLIERVQSATDQIELVLGTAHLYRESAPLEKAVERFARGAKELVDKFPRLRGSATDPTS